VCPCLVEDSFINDMFKNFSTFWEVSTTTQYVKPMNTKPYDNVPIRLPARRSSLPMLPSEWYLSIPHLSQSEKSAFKNKKFEFREETLEDLLEEGLRRERMKKIEKQNEQKAIVWCQEQYSCEPGVSTATNLGSCVFIDETEDASHSDNRKRLHTASPSKVRLVFDIC
jgi:hypothetical protein